MSRLLDCFLGRRSVGTKSLGPIARKQREYEEYEASLEIERQQQRDAEDAKNQCALVAQKVLDARHLEKYIKLQLDIDVTVDAKTATHTIEGVTFSVHRPLIGAHAVDIYAQYNGGREAHVYKTWMLDSGQMHSEVPLGQSLQSILANLGYKAS